MDKKAAILTWCDNNGPTNYGQILQCYAVQMAVRSLGWEPVVVQYRKKDERDFIRHNFSHKSRWGRTLNEIYESRYNIRVIEKKRTRRVDRFKDFIGKHIPLTAPCYTREAVEFMTVDCGVLLCGSDQIWNPVWFDPVWLLDFGRPDQRRIAYAPSGIWSEDEAAVQCYQRMVPLIERLDRVSLREKRGVEILGHYTDQPITPVLDPTLLFTSGDWDKVASDSGKGDYILCYVIGTLRPHQLILRKLMRQYDTDRILCIPSNMTGESCFPFLDSYRDAGPSEFISLIRNARAVCTDSFHGTALSILYQKPFYNVTRIQSGAEKFSGYDRISSLLEQMNIRGRLVRSCKDVLKAGEIDYSEVSEKLDELRKQSWSFLRESLDSAQQE